MKKQMKPGDMFNAYMARRKTHKKNWIANAIKKPGALHQELGVKAGNKIPGKKLAAAAKKGGKVGKRARLAETLKGFHKKRKMTEAQDKAYDRKHGIKEGSKRDIAEDKKHGVKDKKHMKTHKKSVKCKVCGK